MRSLIKIYIKNLLKQKSIIFLPILLTFYNIYLCVVSLFEYDSQYYILDSNTYCIVGFFFFAILLGYFIATEDSKNHFDEIILSINNAYKQNFKIKFISSILILTALVLVNFFIIIIIFIIKQTDLLVYIDLIKYVFIYWYMPSLIFLLIGTIVGKFIKGKISYILLVVITFLFSNLNNYIFGFLSYLDKNILNFSWYITLGGFEPGVIVYNGFYGYNSRIYDLAKVILIFSLVFVLMILSYRKHIKNKNKINAYIGASIVAIFSLFILHSNRERISEVANIDAAHGNKLQKYYSEEERLELNSNDIIFSNYDIQKYDVEITPKDKFEFNVNMDLKVNEDTKNISLMLLHTLKIKEIKDSEGKVLKFDVKNDLVNIELNENLSKEDILTLQLSYGGEMPSDYYIENNLIYLTSAIPFIPSNVFVNYIEQLDFFGYEVNNLSVAADYNIKVNSDETVYSNLSLVEKNTFEGNNSGVVLILNDRYTSKTNDDIEIIYPKAYESKLSEIENVTKYLKNSLNYINNLLGTTELNEIKKVFINTSQYTYGTNIEVYEETLVINSRFIFEFKFFEFEIFEKLLKGIFYENDLSYENKLMNHIVVETIGAIYRKNPVHFEWLIDDKGDFYKSNAAYFKEIGDKKEEEYQLKQYELMDILWKSGEKLQDMYNSNADLKGFVKEYYKTFKNKKITEKEFLDLIEKYEEVR